MREMVGKLWRSPVFRAVLLVFVLVVWVLVPHPLEGPVVFSLTDDRGVHLGDLVGVAVALAVGARWFRRPSRVR